MRKIHFSNLETSLEILEENREISLFSKLWKQIWKIGKISFPQIWKKIGRNTYFPKIGKKAFKKGNLFPPSQSAFCRSVLGN